jgi:uncharacterized membrane protein YhaH (DUF805 family)
VAYVVYGLAIGLIYAVIATVLERLLGAIGAMISLLFYILLLYLHYNLMAKRFHDLNQPSQNAMYVLVLAVATSVVAQISSLHLLSTLLGLILLAIGLYLVLMPGTAGTNSHGAAPETLPGLR